MAATLPALQVDEKLEQRGAAQRGRTIVISTRNVRSLPALIALGLFFGCALPTASRCEEAGLVERFLSTQPPEHRNRPLVSAEVSLAGCPQDGQMGFSPPPRLARTARVLLPESAASALAYYTAADGPTWGVFAPRG
jgi:hypothetical protein